MSSESSADIFLIVAQPAILGVVGWMLPRKLLFQRPPFWLALPLAMVLSLAILIAVSIPLAIAAYLLQNIGYWGNLRWLSLARAGFDGLEATVFGNCIIFISCLWLGVRQMLSDRGAAHG